MIKNIRTEAQMRETQEFKVEMSDAELRRLHLASRAAAYGVPGIEPFGFEHIDGFGEVKITYKGKQIGQYMKHQPYRGQAAPSFHLLSSISKDAVEAFKILLIKAKDVATNVQKLINAEEKAVTAQREAIKGGVTQVIPVQVMRGVLVSGGKFSVNKHRLIHLTAEDGLKKREALGIISLRNDEYSVSGLNNAGFKEFVDEMTRKSEEFDNAVRVTDFEGLTSRLDPTRRDVPAMGAFVYQTLFQASKVSSEKQVLLRNKITRTINVGDLTLKVQGHPYYAPDFCVELNGLSLVNSPSFYKTSPFPHDTGFDMRLALSSQLYEQMSEFVKRCYETALHLVVRDLGMEESETVLLRDKDLIEDMRQLDDGYSF